MFTDDVVFVPPPHDHIDQFNRDGFLVVPNALDLELVARLIDVSDRLMASDRVEDRETQGDGWDSFRNTIGLDPVFLDLLTPPKIFSIIAQLFGPNIHLLSSQLIYLESYPQGAIRHTRIPTNPGWHRDIYGVARDLGHDHIPRLAIKCGYYLTDVYQSGTGMTLFSPGSHHLKAMIDIPPGRSDPENAVEPKVKAGDAVLFENRTFHAGGINTSGQTRKCIMMQYGFRWLKPVDYVHQPDWLIERCNVIQRQMLGLPDRDDDGRVVMGRGAEPLKQWCEKHGICYQPASG